VYFAINVPIFGVYSDPHVLAELAYEAEESGWDGFFIWDHISYTLKNSPIAYRLQDLPEAPLIADPWIALTAIALRTKRIKLGPMVTPLPRRRPWIVARQAVTLDQLSGGRLILGLGLGSDRHGEFSKFGETTDPKAQGEMLDEGLEVLTGLWSGEKFSYEGKYYQLSEAQFLPRPLQQPRIPLWIAGFWPNRKPFRRAAHWDGVFPMIRERPMIPEDYQTVLDYMRAQCPLPSSFDVIVSGRTSGTEKAEDIARVTSFAEVGANWWQESFYPHHSLEEVRERIKLGPLRV
jgi:alkanesulfonate monooxygenase SsuD/methylene tetrahydromethanopterin reductase-like flavin-dependent oxidoreductase (luciferase family)